jgi:Ca2+-binding EF-hand superfamily protein
LFNDNAIDQIHGKSLDEIFDACDKDKSGSIDFEEFKQAILM